MFEVKTLKNIFHLLSLSPAHRQFKQSAEKNQVKWRENRNHGYSAKPQQNESDYCNFIAK